MLSKSNIKLIRSLEQKKYRKEHNLFTIEGEKMVSELIDSGLILKNIYTLSSEFDKLSSLIDESYITVISEKELQQISQLKTPNKSIAIAEIPKIKPNFNLKNELSIALDNLQDPGNMGTIIRTANWFGVKTIYCSNNSVDAYNPKVVQSTMGAIFKTQVIYCDLKELFTKAKSQQIPIYGTTLNGENMYKKELKKNAMLVMGNESKGLSAELQSFVDQKIFIPTYPIDTHDHIESLNVAVATSIVLAEFRRRV